MNTKKTSDSDLLQSLILNGGVKGAARELGIAESTIYKRLKQDTKFREEYDSLQGIVFSGVAAAIVGRMESAVNLLADVVEDEESATATRVNAANMLLSHGLRYLETSNILRRLDALEKAAEVAQ